MISKAAYKSDVLSHARDDLSVSEVTSWPDKLPPCGVSPAGDLQRRLSEAALLGFYSKSQSRAPSPRAAIAIACCAGITSWIAVFGVGWLIVR